MFYNKFVNVETFVICNAVVGSIVLAVISLDGSIRA